jgi:hypothetical protein
VITILVGAGILQHFRAHAALFLHHRKSLSR